MEAEPLDRFLLQRLTLVLGKSQLNYVLIFFLSSSIKSSCGELFKTEAIQIGFLKMCFLILILL